MLLLLDSVQQVYTLIRLPLALVLCTSPEGRQSAFNSKVKRNKRGRDIEISNFQLYLYFKRQMTTVDQLCKNLLYLDYNCAYKLAFVSFLSCLS